MGVKEGLLRSLKMISNDQELQVTLERIAYFQRQVRHLRQVETNPANYRLSVKGYLAELDRMNLEVRDYLWLHPSELSYLTVTA
jgi:hypothetical protein